MMIGSPCLSLPPWKAGFHHHDNIRGIHTGKVGQLEGEEVQDLGSRGWVVRRHCRGGRPRVRERKGGRQRETRQVCEGEETGKDACAETAMKVGW